MKDIVFIIIYLKRIFIRFYSIHFLYRKLNKKLLIEGTKQEE